MNERYKTSKTINLHVLTCVNNVRLPNSVGIVPTKSLSPMWLRHVSKMTAMCTKTKDMVSCWLSDSHSLSLSLHTRAHTHTHTQQQQQQQQQAHTNFKYKYLI